jgi:nucleoside-diphosphate-sugar epimerase
VKVAVTGATGRVGRFVVEGLQRHGHEVRALARAGSDRSGFSTAPQWVTGSLEDALSVEALLVGCDGIVHCAFAHLPGRYRGGEGDDPVGFWRTNLLGTLGLLDAAERAGVTRAVLLSSRAVLGSRQQPGIPIGSPVPDEALLRPDTHYGALKAAEEALASALSARGRIAIAALRATGVYGLAYPVSHSKWFDLARRVLHGQPVTETRCGTEVHGDDLADAVELLLRAPATEVAGRAFNCSDLALDTREIVSRLAASAGVEATLPAPSPPVALPMACPGLRALGWSPRGEAGLAPVFEALLAAARRG